ncbi:MAG TPA: glycine--tRNA ligase subunit beta [Spirochaetota bacterium]|nr:glycine--tRNA ligase subunit beta [Spirochaetota bacterium]
MISNANFLCEIGTEEIPAGYIPPAINSLKTIFSEKLAQGRIDYTAVEVYATPRRFAVLISGLAAGQRSEIAELKGPSAQAAYDADGNPTKALQGFMKGNGVEAKDLKVVETDKGKYIYAYKQLDAGKTEDIIPSIVIEAVSSIPFPKRMKWSNKKVTFPRPINYFVLLFNDRLIPFEIEGIKAGTKTRGHFVQFNKMLEIDKISSYEKILNDNGVILNQDERKEIIRKALADAAGKAGGKLNEDEDLLDTVTYLVEQPHIATCHFNPDFLKIPDIVLITEMKEHQKNFAILDAGGRLMNSFLAVSNNPVSAYIIRGNVKVISARFNDAGFFYAEDAKLKLADRVESLKSVLFHKELGSIYDKIERMKSVAVSLCGELKLDDKTKSKIERAVFLSKADLDTAMVYEFASLQGKVGRIYALNDGEDKEVAEAINEQYMPRFSGDVVPSGIVSVVASLSEKIDNIFGSFSVGNIPKGSQDPYALRRQANAVVELLVRNNLNVDMERLLGSVAGNYKTGNELTDKILEFIGVRAKTIFTDEGFRYDEIDACMTTGNSDYVELYRRAKALHSFRSDKKFSQLLLGFKRMNNIVTGFRKDNSSYSLKFSEGLMEENEEKELYRFFAGKVQEIGKFIKESRYIELFQLITGAKPVIDSFFDKVLVMDKRTEIRDNRLYILENILGNFKGLIDFSKISDK